MFTDTPGDVLAQYCAALLLSVYSPLAMLLAHLSVMSLRLPVVPTGPDAPTAPVWPVLLWQVYQTSRHVGQIGVGRG